MMLTYNHTGHVWPVTISGYHQTTVSTQRVVEADSAPEPLPSPDKLIPDDVDFLLGFATVPGYASFRSRSQGSFYVNKLVEILERHAFRSV